jgi:hypothetical protein
MTKNEERLVEASLQFAEHRRELAAFKGRTLECTDQRQGRHSAIRPCWHHDHADEDPETGATERGELCLACETNLTLWEARSKVRARSGGRMSALLSAARRVREDRDAAIHQAEKIHAELRAMIRRFRNAREAGEADRLMRVALEARAFLESGQPDKAAASLASLEPAR